MSESPVVNDDACKGTLFSACMLCYLISAISKASILAHKHYM